MTHGFFILVIAQALFYDAADRRGKTLADFTGHIPLLMGRRMADTSKELLRLAAVLFIIGKPFDGNGHRNQR